MQNTISDFKSSSKEVQLTIVNAVVVVVTSSSSICCCCSCGCCCSNVCLCLGQHEAAKMMQDQDLINEFKKAATRNIVSLQLMQ